jgi:hypothetical protein
MKPERLSAMYCIYAGLFSSEKVVREKISYRGKY